MGTAKNLITGRFHADSEDSDQTGRMPRVIWVFAGRLATLLVLTQGGSFGVCLRMPRLIWVFAGRTLTLLVLSRGGSNIAAMCETGRFPLAINAPLLTVKYWLKLNDTSNVIISQWPDMDYLPPPHRERGGGICRPWFSWSLMSCEFFATC